MPRELGTYTLTYTRMGNRPLEIIECRRVSLRSVLSDKRLANKSLSNTQEYSMALGRHRLGAGGRWHIALPRASGRI